MPMKQIEQSIINLENNIESVQGDLCEGLYSNIIEVSNNIQSNLDEVVKKFFRKHETTSF